MTKNPLLIDLVGTYELLDRLKLPLVFIVHGGAAPMVPTELGFEAEFGGIRYQRSNNGNLWLHDPVTGATAQLTAQLSQLHLWRGTQDSRLFWHSFVRSAVAFYLSDQGYTPLHAAALVDPTNQLWLFAGYSHSGKSTLTIGLLEAGWGYLGDDGVVLAHEGQSIVAHRWWGSSLLDPVLVTTYPHLAAYLGDWVGARQSIDLREYYGNQFVDRQVPRRLVFPHLDKNEPLARLTPLSSGMALAQLMQHSAPWLLEHPQPHLLRLHTLCLQTGHFMLHLGISMRTCPHEVTQVINIASASKNQRSHGNCC
jgi:hypothetical protein